MNDLNKNILEKTMALRKKCLTADPTKPRFFEMDNYLLDGKVYSRLRVILRSNGCSTPTCIMCPFPNEALDPSLVKITSIQYLEQLKQALKIHPFPQIISIYNDGSFFADRELPNAARLHIYSLIKKIGCSHLMVESIPAFITEKKLQEAQNTLGEKVKLIVGIGLQSASDEIRKWCIRTPVNKENFLRAHKLLHRFGYETKSYLMFKPPFLLEEEAITDAVESATWLYQNGVEDITLCPTRIAPNTVLQDLFDRGLYVSPKLTSVIKCLDALEQKNIHIRVSVFNVASSDFDALVIRGCEKCEIQILEEIARYNNLKSHNFQKLFCQNCSEVADKQDPIIFKALSYRERLAVWLNISNKTIQKEDSKNSSIIEANIQGWDALCKYHTIATFPLDALKIRDFLHPQSFILDYGCGNGRAISLLQQLGYKKIIGCDPSWEACQIAHIMNNRKDVLWLPKYDEIPFVEQSFQAVLLVAVLSSIIPKKERNATIQRLMKLLSPGGKIIIGDFGVSEEPAYQARYSEATIEEHTFKTENNIWIHHFTGPELKELVKDHFTINYFNAVPTKSIHGRNLTGFILVATKI